MDKQALVKEFLKKGVLISPSDLEKMGTGQANCGGLPAAEPSHSALKKGIKCTIKGLGGSGGQQMTPEDAARVYRERFEKIRDMLLRKVDAVSIRNAAKESSAVSVVGMVRETAGGSFILEDTTGTITVRSQAKVGPDDVIAATGWVRDGVLVAENVIYPDIPISREAGSAKGTLLLSSGHRSQGGEFDVMLTPDTLTDAHGEKRMGMPSWVLIEDGKGPGLSVFLHAHDGVADKETVLSWLRRRMVGNPGMHFGGNFQILDKIPDILWVIGKNEPWSENYKGVTMVSFGKGRQAVIDLRTRDVSLS